MPTSLISRGGEEEEEEEEGARARARSENRFVVEEKKKRRRRKRLEGDAFASVAAREEVPGYLGGGVEVSEHDGS